MRRIVDGTIALVRSRKARFRPPICGVQSTQEFNPLKLVRCVAALLAAIGFGAAQENDRISREGAKKLKSPVPFSKKSIAQGRNMFVRYCTACHGPDGKATVDVMGDATDLTNPKVWKSGTSEGEIFRSIRDGAGDTMPAFKSQVPQEQDIWYLVQYIHSLWPDALRPPLEDKEGKQ